MYDNSQHSSFYLMLFVIQLNYTFYWYNLPHIGIFYMSYYIIEIQKHYKPINVN